MATASVFLVLNVFLLLTVATIPWPTALLTDHIHDPESRRIATFIYGGVAVATTIMFNVVWRYAAGRGRLVFEELDHDELSKGEPSLLERSAFLRNRNSSGLLELLGEPGSVRPDRDLLPPAIERTANRTPKRYFLSFSLHSAIPTSQWNIK